MNRTSKHLLFAASWFVGFGGYVLGALGDTPGEDVVALWFGGCAAVFFSWAARDAIHHGKTKTTAFVFMVLWAGLLFLAHIAYLFYTRGPRGGRVAVLKFLGYVLACFLGVGIARMLFALASG